MRVSPPVTTSDDHGEVADRLLRVPARRLAMPWFVAAVACVLGRLLDRELGLGWLTAPVLLSMAVTCGLIGMLVLIRRREASAAARRAAAPWN